MFVWTSKTFYSKFRKNFWLEYRNNTCYVTLNCFMKVKKKSNLHYLIIENNQAGDSSYVICLTK